MRRDEGNNNNNNSDKDPLASQNELNLDDSTSELRRRASGTRFNTNSSSSAGNKKNSTISASASSSKHPHKKAPDVEARKELKRIMASDPWRQTAAALFSSLGGNIFNTTGDLPFPAVERVVRLTLHGHAVNSAVEGAVASLAAKYEGRRLSLIEFDMDVVRPLARMLGCDSGSHGKDRNADGDVGVSSQIRAAQHVIKLFMTPASKLARDEAARYRGKRNFKDTEEVLLAVKYSIERVSKRLEELSIVDGHVDQIFKKGCILEGTGLKHILDLSRFALQDFVQKVKDNRPIAVNQANALRRKIVDRFISAVEKAARVLYDHSSACGRCKEIAEVIRNHINEQRQKGSTFHREFFERQQTMRKQTEKKQRVKRLVVKKIRKIRKMVPKAIIASVVKQAIDQDTGEMFEYEEEEEIIRLEEEEYEEEYEEVFMVEETPEEEPIENQQNQNDDSGANIKESRVLFLHGDAETQNGNAAFGTQQESESTFDVELQEQNLSSSQQKKQKKVYLSPYRQHIIGRKDSPTKMKRVDDSLNDDYSNNNVYSFEKKNVAFAGGVKRPQPPSPTKSKPSSGRRRSSVKSPPKSENYLKPKDDTHECRIRSSQVREVFRMMTMKKATQERTEVSLKKRAEEIEKKGIGAGWK